MVRDHPRSRGENFRLDKAVKIAQGSSPLTRGKLKSGPLGDFVRGIIPAHAGKTRLGMSMHQEVADHPRSRGENNVAWHDPATPTGSSPLTRGKLLLAPDGVLVTGIIPAHAGKTRAWFRWA